MQRRNFIAGALLMSALPYVSMAGTAIKTKNGIIVTDDNFIHADSTRAYLKEIAFSKKVNVIRPLRVMANTDNQDVIRMNSDTLYTRVILDVKGGATISTKDYKGLQIIMILDVNHSEIKTLVGAGTVKIDESMLTEGHHVYVIVRTGLLRDLDEKEMYASAHKAQDNISITYNSELPYVPSVDYDFATLDKIKYGILGAFEKSPAANVIRDGFGTMKDRKPEAAKVVVAVGWGGLSGTKAVYSSFTAVGERRSLTIKKPDLKYDQKGFFSFTIYNANGYIATSNYALNSDDMIFNKDGSVTINFLASGEPINNLKNVLITPRGKSWTAILRCYLPKDKFETFAFADAITARAGKEFAQ